MTDDNDQKNLSRSGALMGGGLIGGIGAFIGASCCVLPLILFHMGVGSAIIAQLGFFARYRDEFLYGALALAVSGLLYSLRGGRRPKRRLLILFGGALALIGVSYILPYYERELLILFGFRGG